MRTSEKQLLLILLKKQLNYCRLFDLGAKHIMTSEAVYAYRPTFARNNVLISIWCTC